METDAWAVVQGPMLWLRDPWGQTAHFGEPQPLRVCELGLRMAVRRWLLGMASRGISDKKRDRHVSLLLAVLSVVGVRGVGAGEASPWLTQRRGWESGAGLCCLAV